MDIFLFSGLTVVVVALMNILGSFITRGVFRYSANRLRIKNSELGDSIDEFGRDRSFHGRILASFFHWSSTFMRQHLERVIEPTI